ncbi:Dimer Tnp hAT domain-containing protein [Citrus sinensis]|nr:Dimer Tnp hAT domain-containing protein [Citrus sinensis]
MLKSLICNNKQRVSLTTDLWTSVQNMSYMVIIAHFIDSYWCLNMRIISFSAIEDHRGKLIGLRELHAGVTVIRNAVKWNSTYLMLMTALKFQAAFHRMTEVDKPYEAYFTEKENNVRRVGPLGPKDWESVERIVNAFSASSTPSMYGESGLSGYGGTSFSQRFTTEANLVDVAGGECDDAFQVARPFLGYARKVCVQNESRRVVSEMQRYLKDPIEDSSNLKLNVLLWWRVNGLRYPILEKIARDVLIVPVSTVAFESTFSTGRRIIDEYKSSLTSVMVEALICTENWLQSKLFANSIYKL